MTDSKNEPRDTGFRATDCRNKCVIEWVSVKDKLPEEDQEVLIYTKYETIHLAFKSNKENIENGSPFWFHSSKRWYSYDVTHWADLSRCKPYDI